MKKILFLQIKGNALGGIWSVNKALGEEFIRKGYHAEILAIRNNHPGIEIKDTPLKITTINKNDLWKIPHRRDVLNALYEKNFFDILKKYLKEQKKLKYDYNQMKHFITKYKPDYIIASHYQTLFGIPKKYLPKTIFVQHSSFDYLLKDNNNIKTLKKLNNKIFKLCWLCKVTMKKAIEFGYKKNTFIYNPNKFNTSKQADVCQNKKIVVITRIHKEKQIDLMIKIVNDVFQETKYQDWSFEIYGEGTFNEDSKQILENSSQIFYKGLTNTPMEVLLSSSLTLNTSIYEGFPLSIIEGFTCGVPVVSFNFGESVYEEIINDYNGYVIENNDIDKFKEKLKYLLDNPSKLQELSKNAKEFSQQFELKTIADKWELLFKEMEE